MHEFDIEVGTAGRKFLKSRKSRDNSIAVTTTALSAAGGLSANLINPANALADI